MIEPVRVDDDWGSQFDGDAEREPDVIPPRAAQDATDRALEAFGRLAARFVPKPYRRRFRDAWAEETAEDSDIAVFLEALGVGEIVGGGLAGAGRFVSDLHPVIRVGLAGAAAGVVAYGVRQDLKERVAQERVAEEARPRAQGPGGGRHASDAGGEEAAAGE